MACAPPCRLSTQPCWRRCRSRSASFIAPALRRTRVSIWANSSAGHAREGIRRPVSKRPTNCSWLPPTNPPGFALPAFPQASIRSRPHRRVQKERSTSCHPMCQTGRAAATAPLSPAIVNSALAALTLVGGPSAGGSWRRPVAQGDCGVLPTDESWFVGFGQLDEAFYVVRTLEAMVVKCQQADQQWPAGAFPRARGRCHAPGQVVRIRLPGLPA